MERAWAVMTRQSLEHCELMTEGLENAAGRLQLIFMLRIHRKDHKSTRSKGFLGICSGWKSVVCAYELASVKPPGFPTLCLRIGEPSSQAGRTASSRLVWRRQVSAQRASTGNRHKPNIAGAGISLRTMPHSHNGIFLVRRSSQELVRLNTPSPSMSL